MKYRVIDCKPSIDKTTGMQYRDAHNNLSWSVMAVDQDNQTYSFLKRTKSTSPAPKVGDILDGMVTDEVSRNGNTYSKFTATPRESNGGGGGSKSTSDPNTMLIAYAKDIVVALINNQEDKKKLTTENIKDDLGTLALYLRGLYESMGGETKSTTQPPVPVREQPPVEAYQDEIDISEVPF